MEPERRKMKRMRIRERRKMKRMRIRKRSKRRKSSNRLKNQLPSKGRKQTQGAKDTTKDFQGKKPKPKAKAKGSAKDKKEKTQKEKKEKNNKKEDTPAPFKRPAAKGGTRRPSLQAPVWGARSERRG